MKTIRFIFIITLNLFAVINLFAQSKVVKRSAKVQPAWIQSLETDFIVTKGVGESLEESMNKAFGSTKNRILQYMVNHLQTKNDYFISLNLDYSIAQEIIAKSELYNNITLDKLEAFYWEKLRHKEKRRVTYNYYLKYSLDTVAMTLANQLHAEEYRSSTLLDTLRLLVDHCASIEDMDKVLEGSRFLIPRFSEDDKRKEESENILKKVEEDFERLEIKEMISVPGKLTVVPMLNNRTIISSTAPIVKSNCAKIGDIENIEEHWAIKYDHSKCNKKSPNEIIIEFENSYNKLTQVYPFDVGLEKLEIKVSSSPIVIEKGNLATIFIASMYRGDLIVDRIVLKFDNINVADTKMQQLLNGAGVYNIQYSLPPHIKKIKIDDRIKGEVHYRSRNTGQKEVYRFYNQKVRYR